MARRYTDDFKAEVMAALLAGQSIREVAEDYDVPRGTVGGWSAKLRDAGVPNVSDSKKEEIGDLLLEMVREQIQAAIAMLKHFQDKSWLRDQDAAEMAVLYGVNDDKLQRILSRLSQGEEDAAGS